MPPTVIFGDIRGLDLEELEPVLIKYGISRLDSAAVYQAGASETSLGEARMGERFTIDTKILSNRDSAGTLTPEKIEASSKKSLERLRMNKVDVLYIHGPDFATPVEKQAMAFDDIYRKGRFSEVKNCRHNVSRFTDGRQLGLCNCPPDMVRCSLINFTSTSQTFAKSASHSRYKNGWTSPRKKATSNRLGSRGNTISLSAPTKKFCSRYYAQKVYTSQHTRHLAEGSSTATSDQTRQPARDSYPTQQQQ